MQHMLHCTLVNFFSTYSYINSCTTSTNLQTGIARFVRMAAPRLEDAACTLLFTQTVAGSSSISTLGSATKSLSSDASAMARFSLDLKELETVNALNTLSEVPETQMLGTQAIMHELSTDSEVTFRRDIGSAEILPSRPEIDLFEDIRPMPDVSYTQQSPIAAASPSVIITQPLRTQSGPVPLSSYIFGLQPSPWSTLDQPTTDPKSLHMLYATV